MILAVQLHIRMYMWYYYCSYQTLSKISSVPNRQNLSKKYYPPVARISYLVTIFQFILVPVHVVLAFYYAHAE